MDKLIDLLRIETQEISIAFEKASVEGEGTPQEVSDRRESVFHKFLEKYFPFPYRIVKGNIIDSFGGRSNSIDCIVINPSHPFTVDGKSGQASIIFADGVDYAIEVKPDLSNDSEIKRGLKQIQSVKKLTRVRTGLARTEEEKARAGKIPAFIFSNKTYANLKTLVSNIVDYYVENNVPKQEQFDMIILNDRAIIFNFGKKAKLKGNDFEGIQFAETGRDTLAIFLLCMNFIPRSEPEISENILKIYLTSSDELDICQMQYYDDLNQKLNSIEA